MKVAFLGTPSFVQSIKEELAKHFTLVDSLSEADLGVVAAYGRILTKNQLNAPKYGCINVHPSLLPKYRGPSPIQAAILNGDKVSGITIIKMDEEVDHGPIIYQEELELSDSDNFDTLSKKMFQRASEILPQVINDYTLGEIKPRLQNNAIATYCNQLTKSDGYIDLANPPPKDLLDRMIRAYYPWPGTWSKWKMSRGAGSRLAGKDGKWKILKFLPEQKIQIEGGKPMSYKDFLNGYPEARETIGKLLIPNLT